MTNIAEILKDYPKGTKLYSPICGECYLYWVVDGVKVDGEIVVYDNNRSKYSFYKDGTQHPMGECLLFPSKENRDWSTFNQPKFKKGDFLKDEFGNIFICKEAYKTCWENEYLGIAVCVLFNNMMFADKDWIWRSCLVSYATEEEKQKLLKAIDENGYVWDAEKFELRKKELEIYPGEYYTCVKEFKHDNGHVVLKVGKTYRGSDTCHCVTGEENRLFIVGHDAKNAAEYLRFSTIDEIRSFIKEKNKPRFKPFDKVLVRNYDNTTWMLSEYAFENENNSFRYNMIGGYWWKLCIPYEGNEHLLGTTENPE